MESDDENLVINPENLNLSDEALPELQLGNDAGGAEAAAGDSIDGVGRDGRDGCPSVPAAGAAAIGLFDSEWDAFQSSIASPVGEPDVLDLSDTSETTIFYQKDLFSSGFPMMENIRREGKLCDVTLTVGEHSLSAHRIVLAANIPYFRAMFTHNMVESRQSTISMSCIDSSALESLVNFAYTGRVSISTTNVQNLMLGASFLQLSKVRDACAEFLQERLSPQNVLGIKQFASTVGSINLVKSSDKFLHKHFKAVSESEEFLCAGFGDVHELVMKDELHVASEEVVFLAVLRWIKQDQETRCEHLPVLLQKVRLPLLTPQFLADRVATEELIRSSHQCRDLLDEARNYHLMPERRSQLTSFVTRARCCKDLVGVIYAVGGQTKSGNSLSTVEVYDPIQGRWKDAEAMSMLRSRVGVAVMQNRLYAIGGYNGQERLNTVEVFDAKTGRWSKVASMNCKRSAVGAVAVGDHLYVCGGFDGLSSLDTVERFDPEENKWSMESNMTKHRSAAGVVTLNGKIYALGGHNGLSIFDSVEMLDTVTGVWTETVPMLSKRCRLGVATLHGKIYACGGYDGSSFLRSVECFDPVTNKWSYVSSMNVTRSRVALVADMERLWAIGGYDGMKNLSTVEMYNPERDEWSFVASMESHEGGVGVGVIPMS